MARINNFREKSGAILNWNPNKGTIWFQGTDTDKIKSIIEEMLSGKPSIKNASEPLKKTKIFVVHGHDVTAREQLELILHRMDLDPYILMNTSGGGMTIIEALESQIGKEGEAVFGIVLLTPDDVGYAKKDGPEKAEPRARQNVILEMGMLLSSLTRKRVAVLLKGHLEQPSDAQGIIYFGFNDHVKEIVHKLAQRLQECGIELTSGQISKASQ